MTEAIHQLRVCDAQAQISLAKRVSGIHEALPCPPSSPEREVLAKPACMLVMLLTVLSGLLYGGLPAITWMQPSCVGLLWGGLFFFGFVAGSVGQGKAVVAAFGLILLFTSKSALQAITDIGGADCTLFVACIVVSGWLTAKFIRIPGQEITRFTQLSIWDFCFHTLVVACICHSLPRLSSHPMLFFAVLMAMAGGVLVSWLASRWVWHDQWTLGSTLLLVFAVTLCVALLLIPTLRSDSLWQSLKWAVVGPLNVIASQGTWVISLSALLRFAAEKQPSRAETLDLAAGPQAAISA